MTTSGLGFLLATIAALCVATVFAGIVGRLGFPVPNGDRRIGCLDGLRGYLALSVMAHHFYIWVQVSRFGAAWLPPPVHLFNQLGAGGVALFFMTTGLVFYPRMLVGWRATSWPALYVTRAFRILPLVVVAVAAVTALVMLRTSILPDQRYFGTALRWITSWGEPSLLGYPDTGRVNAYVLWSLWYEWLFYLILLPVGAVAMDRLRARGRPSWWFPAALLAVGAGARLVAFRAGHAPGALRYLPLFCAGMIAFECQARAGLRGLLARPWLAVVSAALLFAAMLLVGDPYGLALPAFALFFACAACGNDFGGVLRTRGALVLGEVSFSIYLLHGIVLDILFVDAREVMAKVPVAVLPCLLPLAAAAVVALCALTYLRIERPMMGWGRRLSTGLTERRLRLRADELEVAP